MGEVYRARDTRLERQVAVKVLPAHFSDRPGARARFEREARAAASLNHPHICVVHDIGEQDGRPFIAMELLEGRTLQQRIDGKPVPPAEALDLALQIVSGLEAAQAKGIVHRDIKPANIFITTGGQAKIMDFGLATFAATDSNSAAETQALHSRVTTPGLTVGTVAYMSPEQARGEPLDARADIFSFGVVLYEMITGVAPFRGSTIAALFDAILHQPAQLPPDMPAGLDRIIAKALEKDRALRYQSVSDLGADLKRLQRDAVSKEHIAAASRGKRTRPWMALAVAAAAVAVLAFLWMLRTGAPRSGGTRAIQSIAVLPLVNLSGNPAEDYFSDGMTEELIATLAKFRNLRVISRTSVMPYKTGARKRLPEIARELNVEAVVEGSVLRAGDRVRITAQLIEAGTDKHLWAQSYERELRDVIGLQADVAAAIGEQIKLTITPDEQKLLAARHPVDPEVFQLDLKGRFLADQGTEQAVTQGIALFEQALAKDPSYAPAHAHLSQAYASLTPNYRAPKEVMPKARAEAERAVELNAGLPEAHVALANVLMFYAWDWAGAEREIKRAIALNPNSAEAHRVYSKYLGATVQNSQAIAEATRARELDPLSAGAYADLLLVLLGSRQYDRAIAESRLALEKNPNLALARVTMGMAYAQKGQFSEAVPLLQEAYRQEPNYTFMHFLAIVQGAAGNKAEARKLLAKMETLAKSQYVCAYEVASVHANLGDKDKAFEWMNRGVTEQCDCLVWLKSEPWIDRLRIDPRYTALMKRVGTP